MEDTSLIEFIIWNASDVEKRRDLIEFVQSTRKYVQCEKKIG